MNTIRGSLGSSTDWSAVNTASRNEGVQRRGLERADRGAQGLDIAELKTDRAEVRARTGADTTGSAELRKRVDADADGTLAAGELAAARSLVPPPKDTLEFVQRRVAADTESESQGTVFGRIDADGDGGLRKGEFVAAGPTRRPGATDATPEDAATIGGSADAARGLLAKAFEAADGNQDGALDKAEFLALKQQAREGVAVALGTEEDAGMLTAKAAVDAYRKDQFDLVAAAQALSPR